MLLVGGASTRFGSPKALAQFDGESLAARAWRLLGRWAGQVPGRLQAWTASGWRLQPCLCDLWHDHLLFEGDRLAGVVDYRAAKAMTGDREKSLAAGASDYVTKPVDVDHLLRVVATWLTGGTPRSDGS